ncbi:MAG: hypothetical protein ACK5XN_15850, partial [Bacteroidota bacterium]
MSKPPKPIKDAKDALVQLGPESLRKAPVEEWKPPVNPSAATSPKNRVVLTTTYGWGRSPSSPPTALET